jgi:hypothetical protein
VKRARDFSDVVVSVGVLCVSAGAGLLNPAAGLIVFGLALILVGARGQLQAIAVAAASPERAAEGQES